MNLYWKILCILFFYIIFIMLHTNVYILIIYALLFSTDANVSNTSDPHNIISL